MMLDTKRPCPTSGYQLEILDGEIIFFHPAKTTVLYGNQSTALIWQLCDGQRTVADIGQLLGAAYPEVAEKIEADARNTLLTLAKYGLITWK